MEFRASENWLPFLSCRGRRCWRNRYEPPCVEFAWHNDFQSDKNYSSPKQGHCSCCNSFLSWMWQQKKMFSLPGYVHTLFCFLLFLKRASSLPLFGPHRWFLAKMPHAELLVGVSNHPELYIVLDKKDFQICWTIAFFSMPCSDQLQFQILDWIQVGVPVKFPSDLTFNSWCQRIPQDFRQSPLSTPGIAEQISCFITVPCMQIEDGFC